MNPARPVGQFWNLPYCEIIRQRSSRGARPHFAQNDVLNAPASDRGLRSPHRDAARWEKSNAARCELDGELAILQPRGARGFSGILARRSSWKEDFPPFKKEVILETSMVERRGNRV
jgi:hypothetical protein